jgi:hypothetical protein
MKRNPTGIEESRSAYLALLLGTPASFMRLLHVEMSINDKLLCSMSQNVQNERAETFSDHLYRCK